MTAIGKDELYVPEGHRRLLRTGGVGVAFVLWHMGCAQVMVFEKVYSDLNLGQVNLPALVTVEASRLILLHGQFYTLLALVTCVASLLVPCRSRREVRRFLGALVLVTLIVIMVTLLVLFSPLVASGPYKSMR